MSPRQIRGYYCEIIASRKDVRMKATEARLLDFLKRSQQFVIPIYQRTYSWTEQQCRQLWDDIIRAGKRDDISAHFIGSVVYIEQGLYQVSGISPLLVIDGQQRLTTAMLLIEALSRHLGEDEVFDGFSAMKLRNYYLLNPYESGEKGFKLLLTETDKDSLLALIKQRPMPENYSHRIMENFTFFDEQIAKLGDDLIPLCRGLAKLLIVDVAYPFLLALYHDYKNGVLSHEDFLSIIRLIESYVFRRSVCAIPTNSLNKTFATFYKVINKEKYLESIQVHFLNLPSYRRFPNDDEFKRELKVRDLYNFRSRSYWLRRLENDKRRERVEEFTIEHIMPQNENLSAKWREELGSDWQRIHKELLHTLGNLTLTRYNSRYSDRPFAEKRDIEDGFKHSPLYLNIGLGQCEKWDEAAIHARADRLADLAVQVWQAPSLPEEVLAVYRGQPENKTSYSLSDYPFLADGSHSRVLFDHLRDEIMRLDAGITQEVLKLYIAFKAETNFVDVVPQKSRLRLSLNMQFHELVDPKGIAKDVTNVGRWGNGDVEIGFSDLAQLPYIMGLIRQAFEKQMESALV